MTRVNDSGTSVRLNCLKPGKLPSYAMVFLEHVPSGRRNPERIFGHPDYAPYFGQYLADAISRFGTDGAVYNGTSGFALADSQPASFIFGTTQATIAAWNADSGATARLMVDNSGTPPKASYDAVAVSSGSNPPLLYVVNFIARGIEVYDTNFQPTTLAGNFTDPNLPAGYSPFNIRNIGGNLYVVYIQGGGTSGLTRMPGAGLVDIFDQSGAFVKRLITGGPLNAPYGLAIAPPGWRAFGNAVLVANFGDNMINAFDPDTGNFLGTLQDPQGNPIVIPGLRSILFGNGGDGGDPNTLYFASFPPNPDGNPHGLLGSLMPQ
jgi:uncharacterized protein (TIGR03118 family)